MPPGFRLLSIDVQSRQTIAVDEERPLHNHVESTSTREAFYEVVTNVISSAMRINRETAATETRRPLQVE